jgi:hypothetical protein
MQRPLGKTDGIEYENKRYCKEIEPFASGFLSIEEIFLNKLTKPIFKHMTGHIGAVLRFCGSIEKIFSLSPQNPLRTWLKFLQATKFFCDVVS